MNASVEKDGEITVVRLTGRLNYDAVETFSEACLNGFADSQIVFDLQGLEFVGSQGINHFVDTFKQLSDKVDIKLKFCSVGSEFRRILEASEVGNLEIHEDEQKAKLSFLGYPVVPLNAKPEEVAIGGTFGQHLKSEHSFQGQQPNNPVAPPLVNSVQAQSSVKESEPEVVSGSADEIVVSPQKPGIETTSQN